MQEPVKIRGSAPADNPEIPLGDRIYRILAMRNFDFKDSSFDGSLSGDGHLSVCCGSDGLTFLVYDPFPGKIRVCRHYSFLSSGYQLLLRKIREIISGEEFLHLPYGKTTIYLGEKQLTFIPEQLYSPKMAETLYAPVKRHEAGMENIVVPVPKAEAVLLFRTGKDLFDYLCLTFPGATFSHEILPMLHHPEVKEGILRFHLHDSWFYAIAEEQGKLQLANSFSFRDVNDMLYFMLTVNSEFNPKRHPVSLSGWMEPDDPRLSAIRSYFPGMIWQGENSPVSEIGDNKPFRSFYGLFIS